MFAMSLRHSRESMLAMAHCAVAYSESPPSKDTFRLALSGGTLDA